MRHQCLLIADDLTGGADAGAQFAKRGLSTLLVSLRGDAKIDFSKHTHQDVLAINTDSRGLSPEKAFRRVSNLLKDLNQEIFPIIYKKIDSTLRGNIGCEIDAILKETNGSLCFMAPSYPEQNRTLVGGILIVGEKPLALTEVARNTGSPMQESHVYRILQNQSRNSVGWIDLTHVASSSEGLQKAVVEEQKKGNKIVIFDAVSRQDLLNVAEVAFSMGEKPLLVGSAGLAEEVAKKLSAPREMKIRIPLHRTENFFENIFIISGSASSVTHKQLRWVEQKMDIPSFQIEGSFFRIDGTDGKTQEKDLSLKIRDSLACKHVILKACSEKLLFKEPIGSPIRLEITKSLARIAVATLEESPVALNHLVLVMTGGDTAQSVLDCLQIEGVDIEGEVMEGVVIGHLIGGKWHGLKVVTKAGAFGKEDAFEKIIRAIGKDHANY